jgi:ABC-type nitrate/sulfonate/bicarbonate transport system permease component
MAKKAGLLGKPFLYILFILFILWLILFEFILPANNFLPKPGIVLLSIPALFEDYHLIANFFTTISAVYLPGLLACLFIFLFRQSIFNKSGSFAVITDFISKLSVFFPAILMGILFIFWFPNSFITEYIYSFIIAAVWWLIEIKSKSSFFNQSYIVAFKSLGADETFISKNILWNEIKPEVFGNLPRFHLHLWGLILIYEFILRGYGLGSILQKTLIYHDLSALWLIIFVVSVIILGGYLFLQYIDKKFIFWSVE